MGLKSRIDRAEQDARELARPAPAVDQAAALDALHVFYHPGRAYSPAELAAGRLQFDHARAIVPIMPEGSTYA